MTKAEELIKLAYARKADGKNEAALRLYANAEVECGESEEALRAHCLRHRGDILRVMGRIQEAEPLLDYAEVLYRQLGNAPLSLANTLRLQALFSRAA